MSYLGNITLHNVKELAIGKLPRQDYMQIEITATDEDGNTHKIILFGTDISLVLKE